MKNVSKFKTKFASVLVKAVSLCSLAGLFISSNSTSSFVNGQPDAPKNLRKYRKF